MTYLRQPIISVLGHVDHGKTSLLDYVRHSSLIAKEAGGITQHIGATEVPKKDLIKIIKDFIPEKAIKVPGLLFIDTPGHKAFTSLRKRGGSIADIGILVVDIREGFKPQTIEALEILKSMKTPFVVAANKIDAIQGWNSQPKKKLLQNIESQNEQITYRFEELVYTLVGSLAEYGFDADRFDRVDDFTKKIAVIPLSAKTGEGMVELLATLVGLTQKYMEKKLTIDQEQIGRGVTLEVKEYPGLGKTIDVILYDGVIEKDDTVFVLDLDGVQQSRLKSILKPAELKEIRDSSTKFSMLPRANAACGVKLACPDFVDVKAGMPLLSVRKKASKEELEQCQRELELQKAEVTIEQGDVGVLVKADTLGSLEALAHILEEHSIPLRKALIGRVSKKDIIDVSADLESNPKNAIILNFSQKLDDEILTLAKGSGVTVISEDVIYKLVDRAKLWLEEKEKELLRKRLENLVMPFKMKILSNCIFRSSSPAIVGVEVMGGSARSGVPLMTDYAKRVGSVKSFKDKDAFLKELKLHESAAASIDQLIIGRHAQEDDVLYSFMGEENFRNLKRNLDLLSKDEVETLKEIAEIMRKENTLWGL
ncbi:MAG: translation initiation factor IF-2 [Candidatus Woesearchaeota archaeon]|nr:translation initiation factor IF-2 [Nanoarchaeota archaeon]USN44466.1 MAG: translation initiation factor IF-2 [Candidatus Woesearchaeota archaeon]